MGVSVVMFVANISFQLGVVDRDIYTMDAFRYLGYVS